MEKQICNFDALVTINTIFLGYDAGTWFSEVLGLQLQRTTAVTYIYE